MKYLSSLVISLYSLLNKGKPSSILISVFFIFAFTASSCDLFRTQQPHQQPPYHPQTPTPNPGTCQTDQDCTIVAKHSLCCEMEAIAILKTLEATHFE